MSSLNLPSFESVDHALSQINAAAETAEAHGILCGMVCAMGRGDLNMWLSHVLGDHDPRALGVGGAQKLLMDLYDATIEQLTGGNMNLSLFLRNDEEHLSDRVIDLSDWCQGFLYGLGVSGEEDYEQFPNSTQEVIQDIVDICNAAYESNESMEENESAYTEVVEYIRVGVLLIYSELNSENGQSKPVTLH